MKKIIITTFCFLFTSSVALCQSESFEDVSNILLCNAYRYEKADSATLAFLKINFPYLAKPQPQGGLSMPPIGSNSKEYIISLKFKQHPFFTFKMKEGSLNFHTVESAGSVFERGADLVLTFENSTDVKKAFDELIGFYKNVSQTNQISGSDVELVARFKGTDKNGREKRAELKMNIDDTLKLYVIEFKKWYIEKN